MSRFTINARLGLLIALTALSIVATSLAGLFMMRSQMIEDRETQLINILDASISVGRIAMKNAGGDTDAGRKAMLDVLRAVRFGPPNEMNYIFMFAADGVYLAHSNPKKIGVNGLQQADPIASNNVKQLMALARTPEGRGFYVYDTEKVVDGPKLTKMSLMQNVPELNAAGGIGVYLDDVDAVFYARAQVMILVVLGLTLVAAALAYLIRRSITGPLSDLTANMARLADGDTAITVVGKEAKTELGAFARALEVFRTNSIERSDALLREQQEDERRVARARRIEDLNQTFDAQVSQLMAKVERSVSDFETASTMLTRTAEDTNARVANVAYASEQSSANVRSAAAATEELTASATEIGEQVRNSSQIAGKAVAQARATNAQIAGLVQATNRIGEVVNLITSIASQTNLLALNATIEAARAGEAGRGFAVVASEVKMLATETAKATDEIAGQIAAIQHETTAAVQAIQAIAGTIETIDTISSGVSASVEEQKLATNEIASNVNIAATGTDDVTRNIEMVSAASKQTEGTARQLSGAAQNLRSDAAILQAAVRTFLSDVKAA